MREEKERRREERTFEDLVGAILIEERAVAGRVEMPLLLALEEEHPEVGAKGVDVEG